MLKTKSLQLQCLQVLAQNAAGPAERYKIFEYFSQFDIGEKVKEFLENLVTQLTYQEILDLDLKPARENQLLEVFKVKKSIDFRTFELRYESYRMN